MTLRELGAAVTSHGPLAHLGFAFGEGKGSLVKPLAWLGEMSFGPPRDGQATFQRLVGNPRWAGIPDLEEAGPRAVEAYVRAYGPTTPGHLRYWLGEGLGAGGKRIHAWIDVLGDRLATVDVEGEACIVLAADREEVLAASPSIAVRLLPAFDQWVLGPGTADPHVVPPAHRAPVSRGGAVVLVGGVVSGTWSISRDAINVDWFPDAPGYAPEEVEAEVARIGSLLSRVT
jgi:hypothetical protein